MSEQDDRWYKAGCWLGALTMAIVILSIYVVIDCYADRVEEDRLRDLQRRVVELEQQVKR